MIFDFLQPISDDLLIDINRFTNQSLAKKVVFHTHHEIPNLNENTLAIIGVLDDKGRNNFQFEASLDDFRLQFYQLYPGNWSTQIYDLGDLKQGNSTEDTYFAIKSICEYLLKKKILPIIIGGSQNITYGMYRAYDNLDQMVNLVSIDAKFDFENGQENTLSNSYLSRIIIDEPNNLFNYSNVGYQTYYNSQEEIDLIEKLYFEAFRLGDIANNITIAEPVFRDADVVSIDFNSIKSSDSCCSLPFMPNGFNGKEICSLARYSGISDKVSSFGIFNHNYSNEESVLLAQIVWYFMEGFQYRSNEYPFGSKENFFKYIVPIDDDELIFYKSDISERWWIEIPFNALNNKLKKNTLLPCTYEDYLSANRQEIPNRWWKAQRKNCI